MIYCNDRNLYSFLLLIYSSWPDPARLIFARLGNCKTGINSEDVITFSENSYPMILIFLNSFRIFLNL